MRLSSAEVSLSEGASLRVVESTLPNGMKMIVIPDDRNPIATVMLWVRAGGLTERSGQSGISHFLEHCYSLGSKSFGPREVDRIIQDLGGTKNAFTSYDYTAYYATVPGRSVDRVLEIESDRFFGLTLPEDRVRTELDVVKEERRTRIEDSATGLLRERLMSLAYPSHPYGRPVVGLKEDLDGFDVPAVRNYYESRYTPANAVLVIAGDVDESRLFDRAAQTLGADTSRSQPSDDRRVTLDEQREERRLEVECAVSDAAYLAIAYKGPAFDHPDTAALAVLSNVLFAGRASLFDRTVLRRDEIVSNVGGGFWKLAEPSPFVLSATLRDGVGFREVEDALSAIVEGVAAGQIDPPDLVRARAQASLGLIAALETTRERAELFGSVHMRSPEGWSRYTRLLTELDAVGVDDLARVAGTYLCREKRTVVWQAPQNRTLSARAPRPIEAPTPLIVPEKLSKLPAPKTTPSESSFQLDNGMTVLIRRTQALPLAVVAISVRIGARADPDAKRGLAALTADTVRAGTERDDEDALALRLALRGAGLSISVGMDAGQLRTMGLGRDLGALLGVASDVLIRPRLSQAVVERILRERLARRQTAWKQPRVLTEVALMRALFDGRSYGRTSMGTPKGLRALSPQDVRDFYRARYSPREGILTVVGDVDTAATEALVRELFSDWDRVTDEFSDAAGPEYGSKQVIVPRPDRAQAHLSLAHPLIERAHPDWDALVVANAILGGSGLPSRIPARVRTQEGLAYSARSLIRSFERQGVFQISAETKTKSAARAMFLMREELERFLSEGPQDEELARAKARLEGTLPIRRETLASLAGALIVAHRHGLPEDYLKAQVERIQQLGASEILAAARRHLDPDKLSAIVVGDPDALKQQLPEADLWSPDFLET